MDLRAGRSIEIGEFACAAGAFRYLSEIFECFCRPLRTALSRYSRAPVFKVVFRRLAEVTAVSAGVVFAIKVLGQGDTPAHSWFLVPAILLAAALIPTALRRDKLPVIVPGRGQVGLSIEVLCRTCAVVFPAVFLVLWLLKELAGVTLFGHVLLQQRRWTQWLLYQFLYVAVAEEVFFRGYVQGSILALAKEVTGKQRRVLLWLSVILSAVFFAVAHIVVQGRVISVLAFLPGIVVGWLYIRTKGLLGPILFHALANTFYLLSASVLA